MAVDRSQTLKSRVRYNYSDTHRISIAAEYHELKEPLRRIIHYEGCTFFSKFKEGVVEFHIRVIACCAQTQAAANVFECIQNNLN